MDQLFSKEFKFGETPSVEDNGAKGMVWEDNWFGELWVGAGLDCFPPHLCPNFDLLAGVHSHLSFLLWFVLISKSVGFRETPSFYRHLSDSP